MLPWTQASWAAPQAPIGRAWGAHTHRHTQRQLHTRSRHTQSHRCASDTDPHIHTHPGTDMHTQRYIQRYKQHSYTHRSDTCRHIHTEACMFKETHVYTRIFKHTHVHMRYRHTQ